MKILAALRQTVAPCLQNALTWFIQSSGLSECRESDTLETRTETIRDVRDIPAVEEESDGMQLDETDQTMEYHLAPASPDTAPAPSYTTDSADVDPESVISQIRREEFGIDLPIVDEVLESAMHKQRLRLKRAVKRLALDLYADKSHLLLELIQNADDNFYLPPPHVPALKFIVGREGLCVINNENGFRVADIRAICDLGLSSKVMSQQPSQLPPCPTLSGLQNDRRVGKFGVGFKSVFRISGQPHIFSNQFRIAFDENDPSGIGHLLPHCLLAGSWDVYCPNEIREAIRVSQVDPRTIIWLPYRHAAVQNLPEVPNSTEAIIESVHSISPNWLLFLNRLEQIYTVDLIAHREVKIERMKYSSDNIPKYSFTDNLKNNDLDNQTDRLRSLLNEYMNAELVGLRITETSFSKCLSPGGPDITTVRETFHIQFTSSDDPSIVVSFPIDFGYDSNSSPSTPVPATPVSATLVIRPDFSQDTHCVFAYLPIRSVGLKFAMQANFHLAASREEILG